jgi:phage terminase large subunit-like protein
LGRVVRSRRELRRPAVVRPDRPAVCDRALLPPGPGLALEPFQKRIGKAAAGPEREFVCLLPRGQGKTTLIAALAVHHMLTVENAAVYCAAASRDQARILFESALAFARELDHPNIVDRHLELRWCEDPSRPRQFSR